MTILNAGWDGLCNHLRDGSWEDTIKLCASATTSEICEWVQVGNDVCTPHCKYWVRLHSSFWFSATCAAAIVIEITFFICTNKINLNLKESSDKLIFVVKGFLKLPNLHMLIKQKSYHFPETWPLGLLANCQQCSQFAMPPLFKDPEVPWTSASDKAQLQIFWQLCQIKLLGLLKGLELLELKHLTYPRLMTGFGMLVFFRILSLTEFLVRYLTLFFLFLVIEGFRWFWMGSLPKNIHWMLQFLQAPFSILHFSYYILMTFLIMLSVILLSMLMILLSTLSVTWHLICGNN